MLWLLALVAFYAGIQNTLAGGGSFITFPTLLLAGLDPIAANITSTVALFPCQITSGLAGRKLVEGVPPVPFRWLVLVSLLGGIAGALLLLITPPTFFAKLVPWLVLFATTMFAWGSFGRRSVAAQRKLAPKWVLGIQGLIAIYGGYFGGGIGFLMLAMLTLAGLGVRAAGASKNMLAMVMNASAVLIFLGSGQVVWHIAATMAVAAVVGASCGNWLLHRLPERYLRIFIVLVGSVLTVWLFVR
ncbi:sulfite exporter TauE/SafE family protein [Chitinimonas sp.]|uniref:sulfite exporter TauE/SafE family protein n=1 Tax=Chitinimonas sp. TaxID=1934313 RepID=UPI0035AE00B8